MLRVQAACKTIRPTIREKGTSDPRVTQCVCNTIRPTIREKGTSDPRNTIRPTLNALRAKRALRMRMRPVRLSWRLGAAAVRGCAGPRPKYYLPPYYFCCCFAGVVNCDHVRQLSHLYLTGGTDTHPCGPLSSPSSGTLSSSTAPACMGISSQPSRRTQRTRRAGAGPSYRRRQRFQGQRRSFCPCLPNLARPPASVTPLRRYARPQPSVHNPAHVLAGGGLYKCVTSAPFITPSSASHSYVRR